MARELSEKAKLIRSALAVNADIGNSALAEALTTKYDEFTFTAQDVAAQKQAMKKAAVPEEKESDAVTLVRTAREFAAMCGGYEKAVELLTVLSA